MKLNPLLLVTMLCIGGAVVLLLRKTPQEELEARFYTMAENRDIVLLKMNHLPYGTDQQSAFRSYFAGLRSSVKIIEKTPELARELNEVIARKNLDELCSRILISRSSWEEIARGCTRSGFFLCSMSTKNYLNSVRSLRASLTEAQRLRFDQAAACHSAL